MKKLMRFMGSSELFAFLAGRELENHMDWSKRSKGTKSKGFCFFDLSEPPEERLHRLDRRLDRIQRKTDRAIKGLGDFIGASMAGVGLVTFVLAVISADSVPTELLDTWVFITLAGMLIGVGGCWLLGWMRE